MRGIPEVKILIFNETELLSQTVTAKFIIRNGYAHCDELIVWYKSLEFIAIFNAKAQFCWTWIVGQYRDYSRWEREHHITAELDLTASLVGSLEVGVDDLVKSHCQRYCVGESNC